MLLLVPFNSAWINHDKVDLHAIYRRPRYKEDEYGEFKREQDANGIPTWDITTPLPIKQHNKWLQKGFEYITLADRTSLITAASFRTVLLTDGSGPDVHWQKYDQHQTGGPWNWKKYHAGMATTTTRAADQLRADVERFGSDAVEAIRRGQEPGFTLPDHLKGIAPRAAAATEAPPEPAPPVQPQPVPQPAQPKVDPRIDPKPVPKKETAA